jgi:Mrp family chromosome partitioning ATPase
VAAARNGRTRTGPSWDSEPIEVSRHLHSLGRAWLLIAVIVVSMTAVVYLVSSLVPETYEARARIVMDDRPGVFEPGDVETVERRLATVQSLLTTRRVLAGAAARLRDESTQSLDGKVTASVDDAANLVYVTGKDATAPGAAAIANAVARSFLALDLAAERRRLAQARRQLLRALTQARGAAERRVIREQLSELRISGSAGSELALAEPARPPGAASSPRPIRNAIFAFFGSVFLAVLAALALGQLAPRVSGGRELSRLTGAPVVAAIPGGSRLRGEPGPTEIAYRELQSSLALQLPDDVGTVLVAGDLPGRVTSTVAAAMARTLADDGSRTLVVSADLRRPRVHEILRVRRSPGLSDVLGKLRSGDAEPGALLEETIISTAAAEQRLDVLPAGSVLEYPSPLLASSATAQLFTQLRRSDYRHVVVEGPPLLGGVDGPLLARYADALLVVCQVDRLTPSNAAELGDVLARLDMQVVGLIAVGGRGGSHSGNVTPWPLRSRQRVEA